MNDEKHICCICGIEFTGWGNNPYPVNISKDARCCDDCNTLYVIPARFMMMNKKEEN